MLLGDSRFGVYYTLVAYSHGEDELQKYLDRLHLNNLDKNI